MVNKKTSYEAIKKQIKNIDWKKPRKENELTNTIDKQNTLATLYLSNKKEQHMKQIYRGGFLAVLTMGLVNNGFTTEEVFSSLLAYVIAMKSFNIISRQLNA